MQPRMVPTLMVLALLCSGADPTVAADPEIDRLLQAPIGKDVSLLFFVGSDDRPVGSFF
jgi:hypothetical protein